MTAVPLTFAAIDFETANPSSASACAVGVVVVDEDRVVERVGWPIRPPAGHDLFTDWNIRIHGITWDDVVDAPGWAEQVEDLVALVGDRPIVAHNARFDVGVIRAACAVTGSALPPFDYFCSLAIARRTYALDSYRLPMVADAVGFGRFRHHDALADAEACAAIVLHAADRHGAETVTTLLDAVGSRLATVEPADAQVLRPIVFA
ncbi:MAG TPA: exonuclease domain-containing protein [Amnibacterium sp.]